MTIIQLRNWLVKSDITTTGQGKTVTQSTVNMIISDRISLLLFLAYSAYSGESGQFCVSSGSIYKVLD